MTIPCPDCGQSVPTEAKACPKCGHALANGAVSRPKRVKPSPPPEVSGWTFYATPPEILEEMRRSFNEEEFLAELHQAERAGWPELKDFIRDLEQDHPPRD